MKKLFLISFVFLLSLPGYAQTRINQNQLPLGAAITLSNIDGYLYVDNSTYTTLTAAVEACVSQCVIYDPTPETWASNPFSNPSKKITFLFGAGTWTANAALVLSQQSNIVGSGPNNTTFIAGGSFPSNSAMMTLGTGTATNNVRVEKLTLDCNNVAGCTGGTYNGGQEESGFFGDVIQNYNVNCLLISGGTAQNSSAAHDICAYGTSATTATISVVVDSVPAFRGIEDLTIVANGSPVSTPAKAIQLIGQTGTFKDIHIESHTLGVSTESGSANFTLSNVYGHTSATITTLVSISSDCNSFVLTALTKGAGTNILVDNSTSPALTSTLTSLGFYAVSDGAFGSRGRISNATTIPNILDSVVSNSPNPASTGSGAWLRLASADFFAWRNAANGADITVSKNESDQFVFGAPFLSPSLITPTLTGVTNGTGLQLFSTSTTCTTGAAIGDTCTSASITLPVAYADTNYRLSCTGLGPTNVPIVETYTKSNTTFTITIAALTAAAATFSSYDCSAHHN